MRNLWIVGAVASGALMAVAGVAHNAHACGGCFHEPTPPTQTGTVVTDHRMIFSISTAQTTLYDEIKYSGSPASFAWVLPIRGAVTVGLSAAEVFSALEQNTATEILAPPLPQCPICNCGFGGASAGTSSGGSSGSSSSGGVTVISEQTVGPYATVQLQSTDPMALDSWLATNGYVISADVQPVIAAYVTEGFDFLALKLLPGKGIQAMRPVRVTSPGAGLSLPLRMVAAGTGATVGITLWVIADGRYEPSSFPFFTISPSELTWDWAMNESTYTTVQVQKEAAAKNAAWQIESSLVLQPYAIEQSILFPGTVFGNGSGGSSGSGGSGASGGYMALPGADGGVSETAAQAQMDDLAALFPEGNAAIRVTRMRADLLHSALANDLVLQASADQSTLSNQYQVTQSVNAPQCPVCNCGNSGSGGSSNSGGGGSNGSGSSSSAGGTPGTPAPAAHGSSGCAAVTSEPEGWAAQLIAAAFVAMSVARGRRKPS
jgi:hypothetical protein